MKCILRILIFILFAQNVFAQNTTIKLAILDSANLPQKLNLWSEYQKSYISGIKTASEAALKHGYNIQYKPFFYGTEPLAVLNQIPKLKKWNPDIVIGPHYSNQFLLLKKYFPDTIVLSSYASDPDLEKLPKNFYTLCLPITSLAVAMADFVHDKYPNKNIVLITQTDCKECENVGNLFASKYAKFKTNKITRIKYIQNDINTIDIKSLLMQHQNDLIVAIPPTYYIYNTLINKIAGAFPNNRFTFITEVDNWGKSDEGSIAGQKLYHFDSYRIVPAVLSQYAPKYNEFVANYKNLYHAKPIDGVAYMTYITVVSFIDALEQYPNNESSMKRQIYQSYLSALNFNNNWFRSKYYTVYELTTNGEKLSSVIPLNNLRY